MINILNRIKEPSSLAGLAVLLGMFGVPAAPEMVQGVAQIITGALGLAAVLVREKGN